MEIPDLKSVSTELKYNNKNRYGSYEGNTMLYIKGTGFSTMASEIKVLIGKYPCNVESILRIFYKKKV